MNTPAKVCSACNKSLPGTIEFFPRRKDSPDGLRNSCRDCTRNRKRQWYIENAEQHQKTTKAWREAHADYLREYGRKWHEKNQDYRREYNRRYRQDNLERLRAYDRSRARTKDRKQWRAAYRKRRPDVFVRIAAQDFQRHRDKYRIWNHAHHLRKRNLPTDFTAADWQFALDWWQGCCAYCGRPAGLWHTLAMDHFVPLNSDNCSGAIPTNMLPACHGTGGCNNSKHDRDPEEWIMAKFGERRGREMLLKVHLFFSQVRR